MGAALPSGQARAPFAGSHESWMSSYPSNSKHPTHATLRLASATVCFKGLACSASGSGLDDGSSGESCYRILTLRSADTSESPGDARPMKRTVAGPGCEMTTWTWRRVTRSSSVQTELTVPR